jgi:hypothetical protein
MNTAAVDCRTPVPKLVLRQERLDASPAWRALAMGVGMHVPIDRRDFLRRTAALGTALPFASFGRAAARATVSRGRKTGWRFTR